MTTANSGAVFFLGTRAHYQVLQQPESRFDSENGNASTETIYQNSVQGLWKEEVDSTGNYIGERNLAYCDSEVNEDKEVGTGVKRRTKRRQSETALCERDIEMKPSLLNHTKENETPKSKPSRRRINLLTFLASLARRKRRLDTEQIQYLQHIESALTTCTYRESCRCLECQSSYFDCDEREYNSEDSEYGEYGHADYDCSPRYAVRESTPVIDEEDDDDEVFIDSAPGDNTSTDLLIEAQPQEKPRDMSVSSAESQLEAGMEIEVAAGAPLLLNYLLTHPITCAIQ